ncbi:2-succinyl-6-hydroxy-2,4-cyclohexadiene-1-carboxylate synthase [Pseudogracilibacillus auburnensis]|uniref:2-succinyl-6-hydroxy-2, 4-cyclohexadiene-1-carboxylate synthase n=1 Tax=Pseudogracilibacillus auburnensis TaxID=1494959 RepID=UPI001A96F0F6|nr:2-succinyl-6-hydroxy-2,4-cyclohexadiene-1-carboxylate synthase [Pseudogracilibacillus auburnensis]MBO1005884.1 2-succinyl-6-hydroxy-2,4-cyclohexadiene-1-carboxylate synthase [Pseudogracilibacillus auburnensis]
MNDNLIAVEDTTYGYTKQGSGEPIVLLHGFTGSSKTWENVVPNLAKEYQVITIDLPGHGRTTGSSPKTMEAFCRDLKQMLIFLQIETCHLLGYSLGGRTALSFAMYYPETVKTLILESASPGLKTEEERKARIEKDAKLAEQIMVNGVASFVHYWENIPLFQSQKRLPQDVRDKIRMERMKQTEEGLANSLLYMGTGKQPSWWKQLQQVIVPVLLIAGAKDQKFVQITKEMDSQIKDAQLSIIKDTGHAVHVEQVEKFAKIVREFLREKIYIKEGARK